MSSPRKWLRRTAGVLVGLGMAAALPAFAATAFAVSGGVNTTVLTPSLCLNGSQVNCNNYGAKKDVYLSGNPSQLTAGTYFYSVVDPGGQPNPNDGAPKNLSFACDAYTNREFTVDATGLIAPVLPTTHNSQTVKVKGGGGFTNTFIQVGDPTNSCYFADTANPGGVYILAVCLINPATYNPVTNPVDPHSCKYDAFKVKQTSTTLTFVLSGTKFLDADRDGVVAPGTPEPGLQGWTITITNSATNALVGSTVTDQNGNWTFSGDLPSGVNTLTLNICEVLQSGWTQTGPQGTSSVTPMGAATLLTTSTSPSGNCYQVKISSSGNSAVAGLDFFNVQGGTVVIAPCTTTAASDAAGFSLSGLTPTVLAFNGTVPVSWPHAANTQLVVSYSGPSNAILPPVLYTTAGNDNVTLSPDGTYTLTATIETTSAVVLSSQTFTIVIDTVAPSLTFTPAADHSSVLVTVSDNAGGSGLLDVVFFNASNFTQVPGGATAQSSGSTAGGTLGVTPSNPLTLGAASYSFTLYKVDTTQSASVSVQAIDQACNVFDPVIRLHHSGAAGSVSASQAAASLALDAAKP